MQENLKDMLRQFGCEDVTQTSERFLDDEEFYLSVVSQMLEDSGFETLGQQLKGTDVRAAFDTAHMLKGIIANCGITPMLKEIVQIVEPLRQGRMDNLLPSYERLLAQKDVLAKRLSALN